MRALAQLRWGEGVPDCTKCVDQPEVAEEFGCAGKPALRPQYAIKHSACGGRGCGDCQKGERKMPHCPAILTERAPRVRDAFHAFVYFEDYQVLPSSGGVDDQAATLVQAFEAARSEKASIEAERAKQAERDRMIAKKKAEAAGRVSSRGGGILGPRGVRNG